MKRSTVLPSRRLSARRLAVLVSLLGCTNASPAAAPQLTEQHSGVTVRLQAVSPVDASVVWASGVHGTWLRTTDGGNSWTHGVVSGADSLEFRDVHAVSADVAYLLAAGPGAASRIYKTENRGDSWTLQFQNEEPAAFFDCFDFWDATEGIAFSDAVDGEFVILVTRDGATWHRVPSDAVPDALEGEGSFAASGTCVLAVGDSAAFIGTGNAARSRVLRTADRGSTWSITETPIVGGEAKGIASVAFRDAEHGVVVGGDIGDADSFTDEVALTEDGGNSWTLTGRPTFRGAIYGAAYVANGDPSVLVAVGPKGASYSMDDGRTWAVLDTLNYWGLRFASASVGWMVGPEGRVVKVTW